MNKQNKQIGIKLKNKLISYRNDVDRLDKELIKLFKKRFLLALKIWKIKKPLKMKIKNPKREKEIIDKITKESGFNRKFVKRLYSVIFEESRIIQKQGVK